jgi:hypothetical protein
MNGRGMGGSWSFYSQQRRLGSEVFLGEGECKHSVVGEWEGYWRSFVMVVLCARIEMGLQRTN